jgi:hypothetical protein
MGNGNPPEINKPFEQKIWMTQELIRMMTELQTGHTAGLAELFNQLAAKMEKKEEVPYLRLQVEVNDIDNQLRSLMDSIRRQIDLVMGVKRKSGFETLRPAEVEITSDSTGVRIKDRRFEPDFFAAKPSSPEPFLNQPVKSWVDLEKLIISQQSTQP